MRLDKDYPYTSPQIFYVQDPRKSEIGYCKDLFGNLLGEQQWGPSFTLPSFIQSLPKLAVSHFLFRTKLGECRKSNGSITTSPSTQRKSL